jgi:hypothetical protein
MKISLVIGKSQRLTLSAAQKGNAVVTFAECRMRPAYRRLDQLHGCWYAREQALSMHRQPQFLGSVIPMQMPIFAVAIRTNGQPHLPQGRFF